MNIDKRITKCIIVATVLIGIVVTAPVLSSTSVTLGQEPPTAKLTIENYVNVVNQCPYAPQHCPQGAKNGLTTITIASAPRSGLPPTKIEFPVGTWGEKTIKVPPPLIPIGGEYEITTTVPIREYTVLVGFNHRVEFKLVGINIEGNCAGTNNCVSKMGQDGANVKVNYIWEKSDYNPLPP
jgi:hypothetical protein